MKLWIFRSFLMQKELIINSWCAATNRQLRKLHFSSSKNANNYENSPLIPLRFPDFTARQTFALPLEYAKHDWHPKHMGLQLKVMEGKLRSIDMVIEVHDARVALTGRNPTFAQKLFAVRPHILVLNKKDMIKSERYIAPIERWYREKQGIEHIVWTNCLERNNRAQWQRLLDKMLALLRNENRFNRTVRTEYLAMVIGIPNTGKSSLINALRHHSLGFDRAVREGDRPGVTVRVQNRVRILDRPPIYLLDTPGVLNPWSNSVEEAMKLAVCHLVLDTTTQPYYVADYLLYYMNKHADFSYLPLLGMEAPSDDIKEVLLTICRQRNMILTKMYNVDEQQQVWDIDAAAKYFLYHYRKRRLYNGDFFLDRDLLGFRDSWNS